MVDIMALATGIPNKSAEKYSPYGRGDGIGNLSRANKAGIFGTEEEHHTHRRLKRAKQERIDPEISEENIANFMFCVAYVVGLKQIPG